MLRFTAYALPLLVLLLAVFGFAVEVLDLEPAGGATIRLAILEQSRVPAAFVLLAWLMEACGLMALFLVCQGRAGIWWLDGLLSGWLAWVFRGPLLVLTVTVAAQQSQDSWWKIVFGWWILYSVCGVALAALARSLGEAAEEPVDEESVAAALALAAPAIAAAAIEEYEHEHPHGHPETSQESPAAADEPAKPGETGVASLPVMAAEAAYFESAPDVRSAAEEDLYEAEPGEPSGSGVIHTGVAERPAGAS